MDFHHSSTVMDFHHMAVMEIHHIYLSMQIFKITPSLAISRPKPPGGVHKINHLTQKLAFVSTLAHVTCLVKILLTSVGWGLILVHRFQ